MPSILLVIRPYNATGQFHLDGPQRMRSVAVRGAVRSKRFGRSMTEPLLLNKPSRVPPPVDTFDPMMAAFAADPPSQSPPGKLGSAGITIRRRSMLFSTVSVTSRSEPNFCFEAKLSGAPVDQVRLEQQGYRACQFIRRYGEVAVGADILEMSTSDGLGGKWTSGYWSHRQSGAQIVSSLTSAQRRLKLF